MRFQRVLFPKYCDCKNLYFNGNFDCCNDELAIVKGETITADTYFNSVSVKKILKYTKIKNIFLKIKIFGECELYLCATWIDSNNVIRRSDSKFIKCNSPDGYSEFIFPFNIEDHYEILYFKLKSQTDCKIKDVEYTSDVTPNDIRLALGICTYKREEFIKENITRLSELDMFKCDKKLHHVFITDNAKSLDNFVHEWVSLFPNSNVGGSGGFTRCMIELKKVGYDFTHFILMDDDINLDPYVVERTYDLLSVLKEEHLNDIVGGSMFVLHEPWRQFEAGGVYSNGFMSFPNRLIDVRQIRNVIIAAREVRLNYNAWCYCCMPISVFDEGLPLPIFIHMDDIEYGTRLNRNIISISGITVWHPFHPNQRSSQIAYYDIRNKLIVASRDHTLDITKYSLKLLEGFLTFVCRYDYNRFISASKGFEAYLDGISLFLSQNPEKLNENLNKYRVKWCNIQENKFEITHSSTIKIPKTYKEWIKHILKPVRGSICLDCDISQANPDGFKNLILVNNVTNKYAIFRKKRFTEVKCLIKYVLLKRRIRKKAMVVSDEWRSRYHEMTSEDFWKNYLKLGD